MVFDPKERVTSSDESDNNFPISLIDFLGIIPDISPETLFVVEFVDIASLLYQQTQQLSLIHI